MDQKWSPGPTSNFRAGGAITRVITRRTDGVPALGMAEFRFAAPDGVRVYADPPDVNDKITRSGVDGIRTDKATYVFERPGRYTLPALSQPWWDLGASQARSAPLPGTTVVVGEAVSAAPGGWAALRDGRWLLAALAGLAGLVLLAVVGPRAANVLRRRRDLFRASPAFARTRLLETARGGDPAATWRALGLWLGRLPPAARDAVEKAPDLRPLRESLSRALFGEQGHWSSSDGAALAAAIERLPASGLSPGQATEALPPLNPARIAGKSSP